MSDAPDAWRSRIRARAERAPGWMRERASAELHIGGFTQAALDTPVLELSDLDDSDACERALAFFLAVSLAGGAPVARVRCRREAVSTLAGAVRWILGDALARLDDENAALLRYFDVFLVPAATLGDATGARIAAALDRAL